jgi:hypothetical protein
MSGRPLRRLFALMALLAACRGGASRQLPASRAGAAGPSVAGTTDEALAALRELAAALRADDARRALAVGDSRDGIVFWGQPGAYARPLFRVPPGSSAPLSVLAERAGADAYYVEPTGYWREVGTALEQALAVARIDAGPYAVPPEEELERAPPWGSLDTRGVRLVASDYPALDEEAATARLVARQVQRYRFRAELHGASVTVFLTERGVSHVILVWHYDA